MTTTRRGLLRAAAVTTIGAGLAAAGAPPAELGIAAADAGTADPALPSTDSGWAARVLALDQLALACYADALGSGRLDSGATAAVAPLHAQIAAHVAALRPLAGSGASGAPRSVTAANRELARLHVAQRLGQLRGPTDALNLLVAVERLVVGAHYLALQRIEDGELAGRMAAMMACHAQHQAVLHEQLTPGDVAAAIPYGLVQGAQ